MKAALLAAALIAAPAFADPGPLANTQLRDPAKEAQARALMETITVRQITIPADFAALPRVRAALLADFAEQSRGTVRSC